MTRLGEGFGVLHPSPCFISQSFQSPVPGRASSPEVEYAPCFVSRTVRHQTWDTKTGFFGETHGLLHPAPPSEWLVLLLLDVLLVVALVDVLVELDD